jgi:LysM repeat protein
VNPATVVQELITPPAPTETATPAFVSYRIEAGDTLVAIASDQGLTLDELLVLNPDIQPELLMVGQEIILPPRPTAEEPAIRATDGNVELEIAGLATYSAVTGGTWLLGEVYNAGQQSAELVQVRVLLRSPDGSELASKILWLTPVTILPASQAPFGILFPDVTVADASPVAEVVAGRPVYEQGNRYFDLAVTDAEVTIGQNPIEVSGQLSNHGQNPAKHVSIVTTFYDNQNSVTGFHELMLRGTILPGESAPFDFIALPPGGQADQYAFAIQAVAAE